MACIRALLPSVARKIHSHSVIDSIYSVLSKLILRCTLSQATQVELVIDLQSLSIALSSDQFSSSAYNPKKEVDSFHESDSDMSSLASTCAYLFLLTIEDGQLQPKCIGRSLDQSVLNVYMNHFHLQKNLGHNIVLLCRLFHELPLRARMTREISKKVIIREIKNLIFIILALSMPLDLTVRFVNEDPWLVVPRTSSIDSLYESIFQRKCINQYTIEAFNLSCYVFCADNSNGEASFHLVEWLGQLVELTKKEQNTLLGALQDVTATYNLNFIIQVKCIGPAESIPFSFNILLEVINGTQKHNTPQSLSNTASQKWHLQYYEKSPFFQTELLVDIHAFQSAEVVAQIENLFILVTIEGQPFLIDQHACDERIHYEALLCEFIEKAASALVDLKVRLESHIEFRILDTDRQALFEFQDFFATCGIIYRLNTDSCSITHLPYCMRNLTSKEGHDIGKSLLLYASSTTKPKILTKKNWSVQVQRLPDCILKCLQLAACRLSITFGQRLDTLEMRYLISRLGLCHSPFRCAHGRPTIKPMALAKIDTFIDDLQP